MVRARETDPRWKSYDEAVEAFRWHVPERFNIAEDVCDRHAENPALADRVALYYEDARGRESRTSFRELKEHSDRFAALLAEQGFRAGDRCAVLLPQRPETAIAHLGIYKLGAVCVPLTVLFRREALRYRLADSGARGIVVEPDSLPLLEELLPGLPALETVIVVDADGAPVPRGLGFWRSLERLSGTVARADTRADDPATIIYTSGTTGNPKGALHAHRYLIGHLPGFELSHDFLPQPGDRFWTPADWAWIGGLMDGLLSAWHHGVPMVAYRSEGPFDPERAFRLMEKYEVRNAFIPPTALKLMRQVPDVGSRFRLRLRTIMSGGESVGAETLRWAEETLGVRINEIFGQTEINYIVGNCASLWPVRPGSMGRPYPGHRVSVIDEAGRVLPPGEMGEVAVLAGEDPVFFLGYWNNPEATAAKYAGDWARTGDLAVQDTDGYLWFKGRADDVIISAGHRIGPTEVEEALLRHPAVALAAVIGAPDELRGSIVKAYVKPAEDATPGEALAREIQAFVKDDLARHEYPRAIEFVDALPLTPTGKIRRTELRQRERAARAGRPASP